jgi:glycerophosphoryl diester phosphodiesterase
VEVEWDLPQGVSPQQAFEQHSRPDLLRNWNDGTPLQVFSHGGFYGYGAGVQKNSISAMIVALQQGNNIEIDVKLTRDKEPIVVYDFSTYWVTSLKYQLWRDLYLRDVENTPLIIREVIQGNSTSDYRVTNDRIISLETFIKVAFEINPLANILIDTNENEPT